MESGPFKQMWPIAIALKVNLTAIAMLLLSSLAVAPVMASDLTAVLSAKGDGEPAVGKASRELIQSIADSAEHSSSNYLNACASCHYGGKGKLQLGDRSALGDSDPEDFIETTLFGKPAEFGENGLEMPGFAHSFSDTQVASLAAQMRATLTSKSPWPNLEPIVARLRAAGVEK